MKKDSLLYQYKKALRNKDNLSNDELKKIKYNYVSKLFFRIFLSTFLLLCLVVVDKISFNKKNIKVGENLINSHWNFLNLVNTFNAMFGEFIVIKDDLNVDSTNFYDNIEYVNGINVITNASSNGVIVAKSGVVTKIAKEKNNTYTVNIQTADDYVFTYYGLQSVDYTIYNYLEQGTILGLATFEENEYCFNMTIKKGEKVYEYYHFWENQD